MSQDHSCTDQSKAKHLNLVNSDLSNANCCSLHRVLDILGLDILSLDILGLNILSLDILGLNILTLDILGFNIQLTLVGILRSDIWSLDILGLDILTLDILGIICVYHFQYNAQEAIYTEVGFG